MCNTWCLKILFKVTTIAGVPVTLTSKRQAEEYTENNGHASEHTEAKQIKLEIKDETKE